MLNDHPESAIVGDVAALADVSVHQRGGSLTATLKKSLSARLDSDTQSLSGALVDFETGQSVIILSGPSDTGAAAPVQVRRVGLNRFEIAIDDGRDVEADPVTAAFVQLQVALLKRGKLPLGEVFTPDAWDAAIDAKLARARAARNAIRRT